MGKHVEVAYFENATSRDLLNSADYLHLLDRKFFTGIWTSGNQFPAARRRKQPRYRKANPVPVTNQTAVENHTILPEPPPAQDIPTLPGL
jgi:hypothetical protein